MSTAAPPEGLTLTHPDPLAGLATAITERTATVAVIGLGYVGLPLALAVARAGFGVIRIDAAPEKIAALRTGRSYVSDLTDADLVPLSTATFTTDPAAAGDADAVLIAVSTPLRDGSPDLTLVVAAALANRRVTGRGLLPSSACIN